MIACAVTDLPEPDSPRTASVSAGLHVVVDAVDGPDDTLAGDELDVQVTHFEQGPSSPSRGSRHRGFFDDGHVRLPQRVFGSRALRTASPSMMNASTVMVSMIDG